VRGRAAVDIPFFMIIEIRDLTLYERLRSLLPRPDAPIDLALRRLLEQPCKSGGSDVELLVELLERGVRRAVGKLSGLAPSY